jgi:xyloglucan-specific exo-beta-1,4-glucanase
MPRLAPTALALLALTGLATAQTAAGPVAQQPQTAYGWTNVNLQGMGWVTGIESHPLEADLAYVRTDVGGVFRWTGRRWIPLMDRYGFGFSKATIASLDVESIALDPENTNVVYAALGATGTDSDIYRSSDRGQSWSPLGLRRPDGAPVPMAGNGDGRQTGERLAVDPSNPSHLWFGSREDGLFRSVDRGATWQPVPLPVDPTAGIGITFVEIDPYATLGGSAKNIVVGIDTVGLVLTYDGAQTWEPVLGIGGNRPYAAAYGPTGRIYATFADEPSGLATNGGLWRFDPADGLWRDISPEPGLGYSGFALDPFNPQRVATKTFRLGYGNTTGMNRSLDGGDTWTDVPRVLETPAHYPDFQKSGEEFGSGALAFDARTPNRLWWPNGFAVYRSDDAGATPLALEADMLGLEELVVNDVRVHPSGRLLIPVWDMVGYAIDDPRQVPTESIRPNDFARASSIDFCAADPDRVYYVGQLQFAAEPKFGRSDDGGRTWTSLFTLPGAGFGYGDGEIAVSATDPDRIVWSFPFELFAFPFTSETWFSADGGATWSPSTGYSGSLLANAGTTGRTLVADAVDGNVFYAFNCGPDNGFQTTFYRSTDGGASFQVRSAGYSLPCNNGVVIEPEPGAIGRLWLSITQTALDDAPLYRSTDGAASWTAIDGVEGASLVALGAPAPGRTNPAVYVLGLVGGEEGLFVSDDASALPGAASAASWSRINPDDLGLLKASSLSADPGIYGRLLIGTSGRGAFVRSPLKGA